MGRYQMDMKGEGKNTFELNDGWYAFEIVKVAEGKSKSGNLMFILSVVLAEDAGIGTDVYAVGEPKKRWFLKQLLKACNCPASEDEVYDWSPEDVEGQTVLGRVEHRQDKEWIDRNGNTQPGKMRAQIVEWKALGAEPVTE